jgi:predicted acylesterase/phospholipase RssA/CRP-like cAMP-binding protein
MGQQAEPIAVEQRVAWLGTTPLFAEVDKPILREIAARMDLVTCAPGHVVMRQGDRGDALHLVVEGRLRVVSGSGEADEILLREIEPGDSVGEISMLTGERRSATVYAAAVSELLRLSSEQFALLGTMHPEAMRAVARAIVQRLEQAQLDHALYVGRLFRELAEPVLRALRAELTLHVLGGGEVLVRRGDPSDALYVVIHGRLRVAIERPGGQSGSYELRRGHSVGEIGMLTGGARTATVTAVRDTLLARLSRAGFDRLVAAHPHAMLAQFAAPVIGMLQDQIHRPHRGSEDVATIAILPISPSDRVQAFAAQLAGALAVSGPTLHLSAARLEQELAKPGVAQTPPDDPAGIGLVRWLNEQEATYRYVLYEADAAPSVWTSRSLRQADRIVLVGEASGAPEVTALERALLPDDDARLSAKRSLVLLHPPDTKRPSGTLRWLAPRRLSAHYHVRCGDRAHIARVARLLTGHGVGLVLSGGGAPGFAHIGAARAMREAGIPIDLIGGTSQGGLIACQIAMGWDDAAIMAANSTAIRHKFDYTFPITAVLAGGEMTAVVQEMFGDAQLEDMWIATFCVTTNLTRAAMSVHDRGPVWKYTRATTSIPGLLPPVIEGGEMLVDGGLLSHLPTDVMRERSDCGTVLACDAATTTGLSRATDAAYESSLSGWSVLWRRLNPLAKPLKVPSIGQVMMRVAVVNAAHHVQTARDLADFCMRLDLRGYGMLEFKALEAIVEAGYRSALQTAATWQDDEKFRAIVEANRER